MCLMAEPLSRRTIFTAKLASLLLFVAALAILDAERGAEGSNIESFGDALWWAVVTASTVGYGDISPETWQGRLMAAVLISIMVLIVVPLITAHFASKLIVDHDAFQHDEQEELKENLRHVRRLLEEMAARDGVTAADSAGPPSAPADR